MVNFFGSVKDELFRERAVAITLTAFLDFGQFKKIWFDCRKKRQQVLLFEWEFFFEDATEPIGMFFVASNTGWTLLSGFFLGHF